LKQPWADKSTQLKFHEAAQRFLRGTAAVQDDSKILQAVEERQTKRKGARQGPTGREETLSEVTA
jgi:hypothetical protein